MLEFPEVLTIASQLNNSIVRKKVRKVLPPSKMHKFCWYNGDPLEYDAAIKDCEVSSVEGVGIYVEITFSNGYKLSFNDGVNPRLMQSEAKVSKDYQLLIEFNDGYKLVFTVAMYGGIILHKDNYDNEYYIKSRNVVSPFSPEFESYYKKILQESKGTLSAKAFLATEQRFPGIGNGVLQDILYESGIHPKRKISTFSDVDKVGYKVVLSKNTCGSPCKKCGNEIIKETYLGGSIYYCSLCQPLGK